MTTSAERGVRSVSVVMLSALRAALPAETRQVTAFERRQLVEQLAADYSRRYTGTTAVASLARAPASLN